MGCDYYKIKMLEIYDKHNEIIGYTECSRQRCYFKPCSIDSDIEIDYEKYYNEKLSKVSCKEDKVLFIDNKWKSEFIKNKYVLDILYCIFPSYYKLKNPDNDVLFNNLNISKIVKTQYTIMN